MYSLKNKQGEWIKCECVFTVVYDVFIAATTLYKRDKKSDGMYSSGIQLITGRAQAAPTIQRHFERPGPLDPRYQMIDHLAPKFRSTSIARSAAHEPRAAFLLNRFSDTLPILYATHAAQFVLSCDPENAVGRSFYEYIDEGYLLGAVNAIERAKENDSIAYLRLLWKTVQDDGGEIEDEDMEDEENDEDADAEVQHTHTSSHSAPSYPQNAQHRRDNRYEVECLVSASSDGLIVVVRRAPPIDGLSPLQRPPGIFASPWATSPLAPYSMTPPPPSPIDARPASRENLPEPIPENIPAPPGPSDQDVMNSIRDVSVFVWSIASLNDAVSQDVASTMVDGEIYDEEENMRLPEEDR